MSSDEKDCDSRRSIESASAKKASFETSDFREPSDEKVPFKNLPSTDEIAHRSRYFKNQITSMKPKDVSDRTMKCVENYLSQVNTMYFDLGITEPKETLNEVASRISNNQSGILMAKAVQFPSSRKRKSNESQSLVSNDFHYSTLDML